jgi:hypothetical protein
MLEVGSRPVCSLLHTGAHRPRRLGGTTSPRATGACLRRVVLSTKRAGPSCISVVGSCPSRRRGVVVAFVHDDVAVLTHRLVHDPVPNNALQHRQVQAAGQRALASGELNAGGPCS